MRTRIAQLDDGQKRHPRGVARRQRVRLNMMAWQPANRVSHQRLKNRDHARLKTNKPDNLVYHHNVIY